MCSSRSFALNIAFLSYFSFFSQLAFFFFFIIFYFLPGGKGDGGGSDIGMALDLLTLISHSEFTS